MPAATRKQACDQGKVSLEELTRLNQIPCKHPEVPMLGTIKFDLPIRRPNNRLVGDCICLAPVRALLTAHRTRLVGISVDVDHVGHWSNYTADAGDPV